MLKKSCLTAIKNQYNTLTASQRLAADFIEKNSESVIYMSIDEFAAKSGTAKSAVLRCCKALGFSGYSEMKISLAAELSRNKQFGFVPYIDGADGSGDILDKIFAANVKTLHDTAERIDREELEKAVKILCDAEVIYVYAIGTSAGIAGDFRYRLMQAGKLAICITDLPAMKVSTMNIKKGDVAIGISHSGRTVATVESLRLAKESGAKTLCLTSCQGSEITKICDHSIEIYSDEINYPMEAVSAKIAHVSVLDAIATAVSVRNSGDSAMRFKKEHDLVNTVRYGESEI